MLFRFGILRKRPTIRKLGFAGCVLIAEFLALIPSIFPSLEGKSDHKTDGGASGLAGVLWSLCYAVGFVSFMSLSKEKYAEMPHMQRQSIYSGTCQI